MKFVALIMFTVGVLLTVTFAATRPARTVTEWRGRAPEKIFLRNLAPRFYSDAAIRNAIPAWEAAMRDDFSRFWGRTEFKLVFLGRRPAPLGAMVATFQKSGPVQGALAYHTVDRGAPQIVVYSGTGVYYGYDNSVSFTHELEELAADRFISGTNQGWPSPWFWVQSPDLTSFSRTYISEGTVWAQEVSDPVEAFSYCRKGADGRCVRISDFVTPDWFNDGVGTRYDFMGLCRQPLCILVGGYAQYWDGLAWNVVTNFRKHVASDAGFYKGEQDRP